MAYGIQLYNEDGVPALDMDHHTIRVIASGTTQEVDYNAKVTELISMGGYQNSWRAYSSGADGGAYYAANSIEDIDLGGGAHVLLPAHSGAQTGAELSAFYQITTPLHYSCEMEVDFEDLESDPKTVCFVNGERPYKLTAPVSKTSYTENYGLATFDASGNKVFDSRDDYLAVRYAFIVPKSLVDTLLSSGGSRTITLPESMPNAWFSVPVLFCQERKFINSSGGTTYYQDRRIEIQQTSDTTVVVSRYSTPTYGWSGAPLQFPIFTHDIVVYLARNTD